MTAFSRPAACGGGPVAAQQDGRGVPHQGRDFQPLLLGLDGLDVLPHRQLFLHELRALLVHRAEALAECRRKDGVVRMYMYDRVHLGAQLHDGGVHLDLERLRGTARPVNLVAFDVHHDHVLRAHRVQGVHGVAAPLHDELVRIVRQSQAGVSQRRPESGREPDFSEHAVSDGDFVFDLVPFPGHLLFSLAWFASGWFA